MQSTRQALGVGRTTLKRVLKEHEAVSQRLQVRGENGVRVRLERGKLVIGASNVTASQDLAFSATASGGTLIFSAGLVIIFGRMQVEIPQTTVPITSGTAGAPGWVVLLIPKGNPLNWSYQSRMTAPNVASTTHWEVGMRKAYLSNNVAKKSGTPYVVGCPIIIGATM